MRGSIDAPAREIVARELEPDKVGGFARIDPAAVPAELYPASLALLALSVADPRMKNVRGSDV